MAVDNGTADENRRITLYPPPSNSLPPGEGGHAFPSPSMGEGQGEGVNPV